MSILSDQEKRVAALTAEGFTPRQIAKIENISYGAVRQTLGRSPGATGAPAYGARLVGLLVEKGILPLPRDPVGLGIWNYGETITRLSRAVQ